MNTKLIAGALVVIVGLVAVFYALDQNRIRWTHQDLDETANSANLQTCHEIRETTCMTDGNITEDDYSESCFQNGDHVLENPYQCP